MILDARELPAQQRTIECDLCIVGAGPAGLSLAHELRSSGRHVTLVESGGSTVDDWSRDLNAGRVIGAAYNDLRTVRARAIGGTSLIWNTDVGGAAGAKYTPLDAVDFRERDWLPHSGWPITAEALAPWYRKAQALCGLGPFAYDSADWAESRHPLVLDTFGIATKVYQFGTAAHLLVAPLAHVRVGPDANVYSHATVVELVTDRNGEQVSAAMVAVRGRTERLRMTARTFVLAAGAIENARILLSSRSKQRTLGNEHDLVGRFLMEHPRDYALTLVPSRRTFLDEAAFYDRHAAPDGTVIMGRLALLPGDTPDERSLQASATLLRAGAAQRPLLVRAAKRIVRRFRAACSVESSEYPRGGTGWSSGLGRRSIPTFRLLLNLEQAPQPHNRVVLGASHDALGCCRPDVHWNWTADEQRNLERTRRRLAAAFESAGYGAVHIRSSLPPDPNAHHHAGTTRMHVDSRSGVVNADCRLHAVENLYVVGGSVFPTAGFANPTLTIVALAARLAEHLRQTS
jgi:choline dehydrogenase-like flavoprotein